MPEGPMDEREVDRFLNDLAAGRPAGGGSNLAPDLQEVIRLVRALSAAPLPASSRERVGQAVRAEIARLTRPARQEHPMNLTITQPERATTQRWHRVAVDGVDLEYVVAGAGEPVLLIHGAFLADAFAPLLAEPALTNRYRVISYHRRGFAGSAPAGAEASIPRQAADARALLAHLGVDRAHIVGHSYGGCVALQLALDAPEAVHSLALLEPGLLAVPAADRWFAEVGGPCIARYEAGDAAGAVATFLRGVFGPDVYAALARTVPDGVEQAVADAGTFFRTDLPGLQAWQFGPEEARRITQPVLGVLGADSDAVMVSPLFGEADTLLRELLPQTEPFGLPDATHALQVMNPRGMAEGLAAFFARHSMRPPA
jgi:pimeloyl-ACP methyl ester carboxylesterase